MKYFSEKLSKLFDSEEQLFQAEAEENDRQEKERIAKAERSKQKKEYADKIEKAQSDVDKAYEDLETAKEEVREILEASNARMNKILNEAKDKVRAAEKTKMDALSEFNKRFGAYTTSYTGEKAEAEYNKLLKKFDTGWFDDFFKVFDLFRV